VTTRPHWRSAVAREIRSGTCRRCRMRGRSSSTRRTSSTPARARWSWSTTASSWSAPSRRHSRSPARGSAICSRRV